MSVPADKRRVTITTGVVQQLKAQLGNKAPKTVNNVLTVLIMALVESSLMASSSQPFQPCEVSGDERLLLRP